MLLHCQTMISYHGCFVGRLLVLLMILSSLLIRLVERLATEKKEEDPEFFITSWRAKNCSEVFSGLIGNSFV